MTRQTRRLVSLPAATLTLLAIAVVSAQGQLPGAAEPERAFANGDANLDNRLSLDEFKDLLRSIPRKGAMPKAAAGLVDTAFQRLDADRDGKLTLAEFSKGGGLRPGAVGGPGGFGPFAKGGLAKKRPTPDAKPAARPNVASAPEKPLTPEQTKFFESKIRPVLATHCASCHSATSPKVRGGLLVDSREGLLKGGDNGPAVVPGNLEESLIITALRHEDEGMAMPPKGKLSDEVIADFETWIRMGAPDPRKAGRSKAAASASTVDIAKGREFWAFQPPKAVPAPTVKNGEWPRSDIDRFVLVSLEKAGLAPVADADRAGWLRRVTFDLIGLPPTPEELRAFLADPAPELEAKGRVADRLLGSLRFGERWGRHWLDVVRYAESSGKANILYPYAWRYRDWVIAAFNNDQPYDQFTREQLAGDLLSSSDEPTRAARIIATGFLAIGSKNHNERIRKQFALDLADEQIDVVGQAFLGLTIACARCHDHKFDPIPQRDYYALSGVFQSTQTFYGSLPGRIQNLNPSPLIELSPAAHQPNPGTILPPQQRAALEQQVEQLLTARDELAGEQPGSIQLLGLRNRLANARFTLASHTEDGRPRAYAMGAGERYEPIDSPLYVRGEIDEPAEVVPRGFLQVLSKDPRSASFRVQGSGRKTLADRIAARDNPLTARVMVNRIWLHLFGRGIVPTPDNFGTAGAPPTHPELLDALAVRFMDNGWSVKTLIREIILSRTYGLSSHHDPKAYELDPDNALLWRMSKRRLEAEALRDSVLAVGGRLVVTPPVASPVALVEDGPASRFRNFSNDANHVHRAVYLPLVRDQVPESLAIFDFADPSLVTAERGTTSGPTQALYLMNSPFVIRSAEAAADRILAAEVESEDQRISLAYRLFFARDPASSEVVRAKRFLETETAEGSKRSAWAALAQAFYAAAEFRYLD
ncbi:MAG: DUF1553 domain-containing protein [Isosphaeraceae bacterium]|nr:DUF1553 domain-containing protein [Isosphaeraceae bacterium]